MNGAGARKLHEVRGVWRMERGEDRRYRPRVYLIADGEAVIAEATLDFPTLEAGRMLAATIANLIEQQPPEIIRPA
jgi:hypothetical protein